MREQIVLRLISKIKLLDNQKMELVEKAADSCIAVQTLENTIGIKSLEKQ